MNSPATNSFPTISGKVFDSLPESIRVYIRYLESRIQQLETRVHELELQIAKNSSNSSKPPSGDGLKRKPKSQRGKSNKKPGGQKGRIGKGLAQVEKPDVIVTHLPTSCDGCGSSLNAADGFCAEKRQVF